MRSRPAHITSTLATTMTSTLSETSTNFTKMTKITRTFALTAFALLAIALNPGHAEAKDLTNRLGIGFKNQFSTDLPAIAVQYYPGAELGFSAALGVDTQKDQSGFGFMVKLYRIIFQEDNLNFYMGAGAGVISQELAGDNESGFELMGFGGAEFFFTGLENLGFSFEAGTAITSLKSGVRFRTFGDSPVRAGITFYF